MSEKEQIIQAIKSLNFDALYQLLDDNRPYMDVSKDLFIATLKEKIEEEKVVNGFEEVIEGKCNGCFKGSKAYKFIAANYTSLNIIFLENDGKVTDIFLCYELIVPSPNDIDNEIYFSFFKEDKINFKPSLEYLIRVQQIAKAVEDFNRLESMGIVPIQELMHWYYKYNNLAEELNLKRPLFTPEYKAYMHIRSLYREVSEFAYHYENNHLAQKALKNYYQIDKNDEKNICKWLLQNENHYFTPLIKTDNWKKTGFLILKTQPELIVDCHEYLAGSIFQEIHFSKFFEIMKNNEPTEEQIKESNGRIIFSLEVYLKLKNKYLDLFE